MIVLAAGLSSSMAVRSPKPPLDVNVALIATSVAAFSFNVAT